MALFSSQFRHLLRWLCIATLCVGGAFLLGIWLFVTFYPRLHAPHGNVKNFTEILNTASSHDLTATVETITVTIPSKTIKSWLEPYTRGYTREQDIRVSERLEDYLQTLAIKVNKDPIDARFILEDKKIVIIAPDRVGHQLDIAEAGNEVREALYANADHVTLTTKTVQAAITPDTIESLGINSRLATGESNFAGSSTSRVQNIRVASRKYNGLIIKPGERFSFNDILGEVDAGGGYAPEKVIKDNKISYEYGGGICQVSTTLFRAAILAGLPINERKNHSFPVAYYNPQGFDAKIYPGVSDLKFTNDTSNNILVQTHIVGTKIFFDLYGTADGRSVVMDGPYQYDIQPDGSMKASFSRTITYADGTASSKIFGSIYKSPGLYPVEKNPFE